MKVLVTGGTNGMGKGVAKILAGDDNQIHEIILLCRSKELGEATVREIESSTGNSKISLIICDLSRLSDVRKAIQEIHGGHQYLDGLFVNAGLGYAAKRIETEDGMDPHFQVNYLSHFMLTLNLLKLLENSEKGGRVIFNVTRTGKIFWDDMQMVQKWNFEAAVHQAMVAKRMFLVMLHNIYSAASGSKISFVGFEISDTVWSNQVNIIPVYMKSVATLMKFLGKFISIEECGIIMAPLFTEKKEISLGRSGKFITWKNKSFTELAEDDFVLDNKMQERLWEKSLELCKDDETRRISAKLGVGNKLRL